MARKNSPTILQEELYPPSDGAAREELDDSRLLDLDVEQESPFLRGQKRVPARRGTLPKKTANRLLWAVAALFAIGLAALVVSALYDYGKHSWRFRINSSDDIEIAGVHNVTHSQVMDVMGGDIGRNIFFVPLAERKTQLEQIPWVESASVMRFVPNRLRVEIHERTPVAFARVGSRILLIDDQGALMELPDTGKTKFSFPVILGASSNEPLPTRAARMRIYTDLITELDSTGAHYSQDLSEVDLTDPDDVKVLASDPQGAVLVHLGASNYLDRYKIYVTHLQEWRQQFDKLESVDLRYDRQIIVNPDLHGAVKQPALSWSAAKAAMAAGVKPAALITRLPTSPKPVTPKSAPVSAAKPPAPKKHAAKATAKPTTRKKAVNGHARPVAKSSAAKRPPAKTKSRPPVVQASKRNNLPVKPPSTAGGKPSPSITKGQD
jgi:cell division protein FtsQ